MNDNVQVKDIQSDINTWDRLIVAETEIFERRLNSKKVTSDPAIIRQLDELITESDKALCRLGKQKRLAETRLLRAENGYPK